jgi:FKBP-type peptidyl-prolyl cis-trans isomerase
MKINYLFLFILITFFSCGENKVVDQSAIDQQKIGDYLAAKQLEALSTASGLHYIISEAGTGPKPGPDATVTVTYKGYLLDDRVFDQGEFYTGALPSLIKGWQEGIPLIAAGGKIKLIIPSALGYGNRAAGSIPPNSVLVFDVSLHYFSAK